MSLEGKIILIEELKRFGEEINKKASRDQGGQRVVSKGNPEEYAMRLIGKGSCYYKIKDPKRRDIKLILL